MIFLMPILALSILGITIIILFIVNDIRFAKQTKLFHELLDHYKDIYGIDKTKKVINVFSNTHLSVSQMNEVLKTILFGRTKRSQT